LSGEFKYVAEPKRGLSNARNAGVRAASGDLIAFTDDDCYPAPNFLDRITAAFTNPAIGVISGRAVLHDPIDFPISIKEDLEPRFFPAQSYLAAGDVFGSNMAFRREIFDAVGYFDPLLGAGTILPAEDIDMGARANAAGWCFAYCPDVVVRHHHGRNAADAEKLTKGYDLGRGAYHAKLLLTGQAKSFFLATAGLPRRMKGRRTTIVWEILGGVLYATQAIVALTRTFVSSISRLYGRPSDLPSKTDRPPLGLRK
jgi:glycosyltransferase involved in cell wall biosynthesis